MEKDNAFMWTARFICWRRMKGTAQELDGEEWMWPNLRGILHHVHVAYLDFLMPYGYISWLTLFRTNYSIFASRQKLRRKGHSGSHITGIMKWTIIVVIK